MALKPVIPYVENIKKTRGFGYWLGTYGQVATDTLWATGSARLPAWYNSPSHQDEKARWMGKQVLDCVGVDKYARWVEPDGSLNYLKNKPTDFNEDMLYKEALRLGLPNGPIETLPKIEGINLGFDGHWGAHVIDNGQWVGWESRGGDWGVVQYPIGKRPGTTQQWEYWYKNPFVDYGDGGDMVICKRYDKDSITGNKNVSALQTGLVKLDPVKYNMGTSGIDGSYGPTVTECVRKFRLEVGLVGSSEVWDTDLNNQLLFKLSKLQTGVPQAEYDALKAQLDAANAEIVKLKGVIVVANARLSELNQQLTQKNAEVITLSNKLNSANAQIASLNNDINVANAKILELQKQIALEKTKNNELTIKLELAVQTAQQRENELKVVAGHIESLIKFSEEY